MSYCWRTPNWLLTHLGGHPSLENQGPLNCPDFLCQPWNFPVFICWPWFGFFEPCFYYENPCWIGLKRHFSGISACIHDPTAKSSASNDQHWLREDPLPWFCPIFKNMPWFKGVYRWPPSDTLLPSKITHCWRTVLYVIVTTNQLKCTFPECGPRLYNRSLLTLELYLRYCDCWQTWQCAFYRMRTSFVDGLKEYRLRCCDLFPVSADDGTLEMLVDKKEGKANCNQT